MTIEEDNPPVILEIDHPLWVELMGKDPEAMEVAGNLLLDAPKVINFAAGGARVDDENGDPTHMRWADNEIDADVVAQVALVAGYIAARPAVPPADGDDHETRMLAALARVEEAWA